MVKLHIKKGDQSQFLYETTVETPVTEVLSEVSIIYNGRLKIERICAEMEEMAKHGLSLPPNMQGLTDEQVEELKLVDEWGEKCSPSGGVRDNRDPIGRRNGKAPTEKMAEVLTKTVNEAKALISKKQVECDVYVTRRLVQEALDLLRGACTIVYPMGLPPHEPVHLEFDNQEDLSGTQASKEVIEPDCASLWWAGKEMQRGKLLKDHVGRNEKTKIVAKIQKRGQGAPAREPVVTEHQQREMMAHYYKKQEEMKKLAEDDSEDHLGSDWADNSALKRSFQGMHNIRLK